METTTNDRKFISIAATAHQLDLSTRGVYRLIAKGILPRPVKVGSSTKFFVSDLEDYYQALQEKRAKFTWR